MTLPLVIASLHWANLGGTTMPADNRIEAAPPADVIVHNGRIATQDDRR